MAADRMVSMQKSPTVHFLRDPHSLVYNFPPSLERIPPREKFAAHRLPGYVTASQDKVGSSNEMLESAKR